MHLPCKNITLPSLELKTWPEQFLGYSPFDIVLPLSGNRLGYSCRGLITTVKSFKIEAPEYELFLCFFLPEGSSSFST